MSVWYIIVNDWFDGKDEEETRKKLIIILGSDRLYLYHYFSYLTP
jgi:hypothetical protein